MQNTKKSLQAKKGTLSRLLKLVFKENSFKLLLVLALMLISTFSNVIAVSTIQQIIDESVLITEGLSNYSEVTKLIIKMIIFYSVSVTFSYFYLRVMVDVGQDSLLYIRTNLFDHMMRLPLSYFDSNQHGDLMSRYTNDVDATRQMVSQSLPQIASSLFLMFAYVVMMFITSWLLAIVTLFVSSIIILLTRIIAKGTKKYFIEQQKNIGAINGYIEEMVEGQKVIKVFRREEKAIEGYSKLNRRAANTARISVGRSGMLIPITVNLGYLSFAIAAILGAILVANENYPLSIGQLVVYLLFVRQFTGPINRMGQQLNFVQMALAGASRVFEVMDLKPEVDEGTVTLVNIEEINGELCETDRPTIHWAWKKADGTLIELKGDVRFNNVTFSYVAGKPVLKNINLFAKPGQKIAFVGSTGAGKTTITNLINRFYDIQEGEILFDGVNVKDIKKDSLRRSLGVVLQDTHLFQTTVRENIRYGNLSASDIEVVNAAKRANAHDFIMKLPQGYDTVVTDDGANLSQGQRQLLSIARAAISNPPVLVLDEATSSIDTYTERLINEGMDKLMEGRTVFVIAHRLSTIKNAKAIMILEQGEIIERGNHNHLIEQKGIYYQLYTGVFEFE